MKSNARDNALFVMGTNLAFRASDLLALNLGDVRSLKVGDILARREKKTSKRRVVTVNAKAIAALEVLLRERQGDPDDAPLFIGQKRKTRLTVATLGRLVKDWCEKCNLEGTFASHTLRKTFGYTMRTEHNVPLEVLQRIYGHSSGAITLTYVCIQPEEMREAYMLGV